MPNTIEFNIPEIFDTLCSVEMINRKSMIVDPEIFEKVIAWFCGEDKTSDSNIFKIVDIAGIEYWVAKNHLVGFIRSTPESRKRFEQGIAAMNNTYAKAVKDSTEDSTQPVSVLDPNNLN